MSTLSNKNQNKKNNNAYQFKKKKNERIYKFKRELITLLISIEICYLFTKNFS